MSPSVDGDQAEKVRGSEYTMQRLNQQDLDRNFSLATSQLLKWMQAARMDLPWMQPGYTGLSSLHPASTRRLLVASQILSLSKPGVLAEAAGHEVVVHCEVGSIGRTSIEFCYTILFGSRPVATGSTTMIVVSGSPGLFKTSAVPEGLRPLGAAKESPERAFLLRSLASLPREAPQDAYVYAMTVRFSDEDVNKHANHSALARFLEDAREALLADEGSSPELRRVAAQPLGGVLIEYGAETRANDELEIRVATSEHGILTAWVRRRAPNRFGGVAGPVGRGQLLCGSTVATLAGPPSARL